MEPMPEKNCFYTRIIVGCLLLLMWPLYAFCLYKWFQHRSHFVIRNRWPGLSLVVVTLVITVQILTIVESSMCLSFLSPVSVALSNIINGVVFYRGHLLIQRYLASQHHLNAMDREAHARGVGFVKSEYVRIHLESLTAGTTKMGVFCRWFWSTAWPKMIIFSTAATSSLIAVMRFMGITGYIGAAFGLTTAFGVVTVIRLLWKRVKDGIDCTKECLIQIICNFLLIGLNPVLSSALPSYIEISYLNGLLVVTFYGLLTLAPALRLVQKVEAYSREAWANMASPSWGTHSDSDHGMVVRMETMDRDQSPGANTLKSPVQAGLSVADSNHSTHSLSGSTSVQNIAPDRKVTRRATKCLTKPLYRFLGDADQFTLFAGYLSQCFALENLLFLERAIILYHIILSMMEKELKETQSDGNELKTEEAKVEFELDAQFRKEKVYLIRFDFLVRIRSEMEEMIAAEDDPKKGILEVMKVIYSQFCSPDFDTEINVSYPCKSNLHQLFRNDDAAILAQFGNYEDCLRVFHVAIVECYRLCCSVYGFQFRQYVRKHVAAQKTDGADPEGLSTPLTPER